MVNPLKLGSGQHLGGILPGIVNRYLPAANLIRNTAVRVNSEVTVRPNRIAIVIPWR